MVKLKLFLGTSGCVCLAWLGGALGNSYINSLKSQSRNSASQEFDDTNEEYEVVDNHKPSSEAKDSLQQPKLNKPIKKKTVENKKIEIPETQEMKEYKQQLLQNIKLTNIVTLLSNPINQHNDKQTTEEKIQKDYADKLSSLNDNNTQRTQSLIQKNTELKKKLNSISEKRKQLKEARKAYKLLLDALFKQFQNPDNSDKLEIILTKQELSSWDDLTQQTHTTFSHEGDELKNLKDLFTYKEKPLIPKKQIHDFYYSEQDNSIQQESYEVVNFLDKTMTDSKTQSHPKTNYIDSATFKEAQFEHEGTQYSFAIKYYTNDKRNLFISGLLDAQSSITEIQEEIINIAGNDDKWFSLDY